MKIVFLIPPSEGKNKWWNHESEQLSFIFEKPASIVAGVTPKDLHCKDKRYEEALQLNRFTLDGTSWYMPAIERYSGVMYNAIDYAGMSQVGKRFFEENFLIISGMYGLVSSGDVIGDYKLPIWVKWLYSFWWDSITQALRDAKPDIVVNLLPQAYAKVIDFDALETQVVHVVFMKYRENNLVNMAHGVKKVKWEWIKNVCEKQLTHYTLFEWEMRKDDTQITIQIIQK